MGQQPTDEDLTRIMEALLARQLPTITGAELGMLVRRNAPNIDIRAAVDMPPFGTGALARFVSMYLSHVLRKAGQTASDGTGGDNIYQVIDPAGSNPDIEPEAKFPTYSSTDYWSAFVRPSETRILIARKTGESPELLFADGSEPTDGHRITSISNEELDTISKEFLQILNATPDSESLAASLHRAGSYAEFIQLLKEAGNAYFQHWSEHRREKLRKIFLERLNAADFSLPDQQKLLEVLDKSQESAHQQIRSKALYRAAENKPLFTLGPLPTSPGTLNHSRELLKAVVDRMSIQELRALSIPFGHILDALQALPGKK